MKPDDSISRADLLAKLALAPVVIAALAPAAAMAADNKASFKYQAMPKGSAKCSGCTLFAPNKKNPKSSGTCKVVTGPISPSGWCIAYSAKK